MRRSTAARVELEPLVAFLLPLAACALGLAVLSWRDLDGRLLEPFYDREHGSWPYRDQGPAAWLHEAGRDLVSAIVLAALAVLVAGFFSRTLRAERSRALFVFLAIVIPIGAVALVKHWSSTPCPWESVRFGGDIVHVGPFRTPPPGSRAGRCFPGAHATGGYALMCAYYALRHSSRRWAWLGLLGGALIGTLFGATQVVRGAHWPSHNLWAAAMVWVIVSALYWLIFRKRIGACRITRRLDSNGQGA